MWIIAGSTVEKKKKDSVIRGKYIGSKPITTILSPIYAGPRCTGPGRLGKNP